MDASQSQHFLTWLVVTHADGALLFILVNALEVIQGLELAHGQLVKYVLVQRLVGALDILFFELVEKFLGDLTVPWHRAHRAIHRDKEGLRAWSLFRHLVSIHSWENLAINGAHGHALV